MLRFSGECVVLNLMRLAIFASGMGSTAEVLFKYAAVVITNNPEAGVIKKAKEALVPVEVVEKGNLNLEQFGEKIIEVLEKYEFDFISQNGWEMITPLNVCDKFEGKITNNHPAPLDPGYPDFGGKGMKGTVVHQAVLNFASKISREFNSEICIHLVNGELDKGELLAYEGVEILKGDKAVDLQNRVKEVEKKLIGEFWEKAERDGELIKIKRVERLIKPEEFGILEEAKAEALKA